MSMKISEKSVGEYILYIDTANETAKIALFQSGKIIDSETWIGHSDLSVGLFLKISRLLKKAGVALSNLSKIAVNSGPGSYTGLRIGITTANFLGWSLKIPIMSANFDGKKLRIFSKPTKFVLPKYSHPAKITVAKKFKV